jgi:hypothetical protein
MGFIKVVDKKCDCNFRPNAQQYGAGTIWECEYCKQQWKIVYDDYARYPDPPNFWRKLNYDL